MKPSQLLQQAGLDNQETAVYLALVQLQEATAGNIAKHSGVPRTYAYKILESLEQNGLVMQSLKPGIRRYQLTDLEAPLRYIERQQYQMYQVHQAAQSLSTQLENMSSPDVSTATVESLAGDQGLDELFQLLHSTISREIWVINPPQWWGDEDHNKLVEKWESTRLKQHIWEKRISGNKHLGKIPKYTEMIHQKSVSLDSEASLILIDHYQVQVSSWLPFRAIRIDNQEIVDVMKASVVYQ